MSKQPLPQMPRWDGPLSHPFYSHVVKRIIDFLFALILLIPGCIIMLPLAIWVKLDSPGPVLYKAVRGGYHNQPFYIYKFRSMVVGADKTGGCTALNDSRVTRAGKVMRRLKLDELPQLFNILKGDMSFVGPRPELLLYTTQYTKEHECHRGDLIAIRSAGAYGEIMASQYNCRKLPVGYTMEDLAKIK